MAQPQSGCYRCCCPPCAVMEIEGCSGMAVCCWIACFTVWPINGFINLCYTPVPKQPVVAQQGYSQPITGQPVTQPVQYNSHHPTPSAPPAPPSSTRPQPYGV
eukprot:TRINITY_DN1137_c0_g5_i1.p2 TRINITY_DN1137_c0_g5~~TRINITY_DN1137_c0_g5_i1.p2  ORF type:complete len:119 (+),score=18.02 TRINITY_DN1137_c0_g5_i1:51-359(+)